MQRGKNSKDCLKNCLNSKWILKFPKSWENSQAVEALLLKTALQTSDNDTQNIVCYVHYFCHSRMRRTDSVAYVCMLQLWKALTQKVYFRLAGTQLGQVRMSRSSNQGQGHRSIKACLRLSSSRVICLRLRDNSR